MAAAKKKNVAKKPMTLGFVAGADPKPIEYVYDMQLPKLPFTPEGASGGKMAMDDAGGQGFPYQGYMATGGIGNYSLYFPGYPTLSLLAQRTEYRQPVETHAKDMTREWIVFTSKSAGDKSKRIEELEKRCTILNLQGVVQKSLIHDGFFGVGHIFIDIKDKPNTSEPIYLDPKSIAKGTLRGFVNIEPMWVTPVAWNSYDATAPSFYVPDKWVTLSKTCDKTRLIQVISREVPDIIKPAYNFGGISLSQLIQPYVDRWLRTVEGVNRMINNYSLIFLKTDMSAVLEGGPDTDIRRRMKMARMQGDNMGMFLLDMTNEELGNVATPLSGLSELQAQAQEHMAMPTHLPLVVLTGITPSGLNASSDGEIEVYHDWNRSEQNAVIRKPIMHMVHVVMLDLWGEIDEGIDFKFVPIKQVTGEALARITKMKAEADQIYMETGVVDNVEVRQKVARDEDSGFVNLDINKIPKPLAVTTAEGMPQEPDSGSED